MMPRSWIVLCGIALLAGAPVSAQDADVMRTAPEKTNYVETTRYADAVAFMPAAAAASPVIHLDTMGYTLEGRALVMAIVGDLPDSSPEAVRASGRTRIYIQGNIHGGEVE